MLEPIRNLDKSLVFLEKNLHKQRSKRICRRDDIDAIVRCVDEYFYTTRKTIVNIYADQEKIQNLDNLMQQLLDVTHKKSTHKRCKSIISHVRKALHDLEINLLLVINKHETSSYIDNYDNKILLTLKKLVPMAALSYEQALIDLRLSTRQSWRGPAVDLRESLRECLDYMAPDSEVVSQPGFKYEMDLAYPTLKQKVVFVLHKRKVAKNIKDTSRDAVDVIEGKIGNFVRSVYSRASGDTHTIISREEVQYLHDYIKVVFCEILEIH